MFNFKSFEFLDNFLNTLLSFSEIEKTNLFIIKFSISLTRQHIIYRVSYI